MYAPNIINKCAGCHRMERRNLIIVDLNIRKRLTGLGLL